MAGKPDEETASADHAGVGGSRAAADLALRASGRYEPIDELARGGIGRIVRARDLAFDRIVAIKEPLARDGADRLRTEANILASLQHPSIVPIFDQGTRDDGVPFFAMKLVDGRSLRDVIRATTSLEARLALIPKVIAVAEAMAYAHGQAVIHRDLKPANVLVGAFDETVVIDWGLAKVLTDDRETVDGRGKGGRAATPAPVAATITNTGDVMGTPAYMAPEQARGEPVDARADVYALGAMLYDLIAGAAPAPVGDPRPIEEVQPRTPAELVAIVHKAMAREPADRYPTAAGFADDLGRYQRAVEHPPRRVWPLVAGGVVIAGAAVAAVVMLRPSNDDDTPSVVATPTADAAPSRVPDLGGMRDLTSYGLDGCAYTPAFVDADTVVFDRTWGDAVDLFAADLDGAARQLTSAPTWEWRVAPGRAPGEVLYLINNTDNYAESWLGAYDLGRGVEEKLAQVFGRAVAALDGAVLYIGREATLLHRRRGSDDEVIHTAPIDQGYESITVSPAGDLIALNGPSVSGPEAGAFAICVLRADDPSSCMQQIPSGPARPAFGADGRSIYHIAADGLRRYSLDDGADELIVPDAVGEGGIAVSPDGRSLVYSGCGAQMEIVDLAVSPPRPLVTERGAQFPAVGPGGLLAWVQLEGLRRVLMVRLPDGETRQLTSPSLGTAVAPSFSPNGSRLAFYVTGREPGIYVINVRSFGVAQRLTTDAHDRDPLWLTDGLIAFTRYGTDQVPTAYTLGLDGGDPTAIVTSTRYAVASNHATRELLVYGASGRFLWWSADTRRERPAARVADGTVLFAYVSPDGKWLGYQIGTNGGEVWRQRLPDGAPEHVWTSTQSQTTNRGAITDDGAVIVSPQTWAGDLRLIPAAAGSRY